MAFRDEITVSRTIPAGTYFVGDPGYAFDDHGVWMELLKSADFESRDLLEASARGRSFVASGTAYGDGEYEDREGRRYPVDAGLIGVVPARGKTPWGMHRIEFPDEFTVSYEDGTIYIGTIAIETDPRFECDGLRCNTEVEEWEDYCPDCAAEFEEQELGEQDDDQ
jgi:hypothetical protein